MKPSRLALVLFLLTAAHTVVAQSDIPRPLDVEMTPTGEAYLDAVRWRWLQSRITYFDPDRAAPPLDVAARIPRDPSAPVSERQIDWTTTLIGLAIIMAILALILRFGNFSVIGLRREEDDGPARAGQSGQRDMSEDRIEALEGIRAITDRGEALNRLLAAALALAARAADLRLDPSWTVRDALRRIPRSWPFRNALSQLARDAELAHFGGRAVTEDQFERHLQAMVPVFREAGA